jgi:DNA uptake protein ComE-like DNA-binding protein
VTLLRTLAVAVLAAGVGFGGAQLGIVPELAGAPAQAVQAAPAPVPAPAVQAGAQAPLALLCTYPSTTPAPGAPAPAQAPAPANTAGLVNLNTATDAELDKLPDVGGKRIAAIKAARPYASVADLSKVPERKLPASVRAALAPLVTV